MASSNVEVTPPSELQFLLTQDNNSTKSTMTLRNPGTARDSLAFKIKTTQPRRYLVRPNQGLIPPGSTEEIQILLVDKDKSQLLQSYQRLGQSALDHCKDKFLVQTTVVSTQFSQEYLTSDNGYDKLSSLWAAATSANSGTAISNKKLHVKHVVQEPGGSPKSPSAALPVKHEAAGNPADMTQDQLLNEMNTLRRKYDELVAFSVNLTAERDILNNTLEQTKRDLNRELLSNKNSGGGATNYGTSGSSKASSRGGSSLMSRLVFMIVVGLLFFTLGARMEGSGQTQVVKDLPIIGTMLIPPPADAESNKKKKKMKVPTTQQQSPDESSSGSGSSNSEEL